MRSSHSQLGLPVIKIVSIDLAKLNCFLRGDVH